MAPPLSVLPAASALPLGDAAVFSSHLSRLDGLFLEAAGPDQITRKRAYVRARVRARRLITVAGRWRIVTCGRDKCGAASRRRPNENNYTPEAPSPRPHYSAGARAQPHNGRPMK